MDKIKEAFQLIKDDIFSLQNELNYIKESIQTNNQNIKEIVEILSKLHEKTERLEKEKSLDTQTDQQTDRHINSTVQTHPSTHNLPLEDLKPINLVVSKGNRGVSTDRQTDRQTGSAGHGDAQRSDAKEREVRRRANATPGGALMPAADYSTRSRGDGRGRRID